jgi:hypothetical protein
MNFHNDCMYPTIAHYSSLFLHSLLQILLLSADPISSEGASSGIVRTERPEGIAPVVRQRLPR